MENNRDIKQEYRERWKNWYYNNKQKCLDANKRYYEKNRQWIKKFRKDLKLEVVTAYGGKCECCDESHWQFLTLDHVDGNGQTDRAKYRNVTGALYGWIKRNNFPKNGYRLLCMNCNWIRRFGGTCPHQE